MYHLVIHTDAEKKKTFTISQVGFWDYALYYILSGEWLFWANLPRWPKIIKSDGYWYSLGEYYGTLGSVLFIWYSRRVPDKWRQWEEKRSVSIPITKEIADKISKDLWGHD